MIIKQFIEIDLIEVLVVILISKAIIEHLGFSLKDITYYGIELQIEKNKNSPNQNELNFCNYMLML